MANNLMHSTPFRNIAQFDPFHNMEDLFRAFSMIPSWRDMDISPAIRMDISDDGKNYTVKADIPGVKKEDIKIAIEGSQVTISAEVKQETEQNEQGRIRSERYYGQQYRTFNLPQEVDDGKAQAKYENGVLQLTLPKKNDGVRKQISVQ